MGFGKREATRIAALALVTALTSAACATRRAPATGAPPPPVVDEAPAVSGRSARTLHSAVGLASYYGQAFHGKTTASGVRFDMRQAVAAHPSYPFGTRVRVTNLTNNRHIVVTVIDRGPTETYQADGVIIDLAQGAARALGFIRKGRQRVRVDVIEWGNGT